MRPSTVAPKERRHFSISEIQAYLACPLSWWYRYRLHLFPERTTSYFALGTAVHAGLEQFYNPLAPRDAEKARAFYRRVWTEESGKVDWTEEPGDKDPLLLGQSGLGLLDAAITAGDEWEAESVETTLYADLRHSTLGALPYPIKAKLDMLTTAHDIVDHKTADKSWPEGKEHSEAQATGYIAVVRENFGHDATMTYNILVNNRVPKVERRSTRRTQQDIDRLYVIARAMLRAEETGAVYPNPTSWLHNRCEFRALCDTWTEHPQMVPNGPALSALVKGLPERATR